MFCLSMHHIESQNKKSFIENLKIFFKIFLWAVAMKLIYSLN